VTSAHIAGVPLEETILQLAPAGVALAATMQLTRDRTRRLWRRVTRSERLAGALEDDLRDEAGR
jgi:hypothetical protein